MNIIKEVFRIREVMGLREDAQLANKLYFKNDLLSGDIKDAIFNITGGDNFTKLVSDLYYHMSKFTKSFEKVNNGTLKLCEYFYRYLTEYNKNSFPVPGNLTDYGVDKENRFHVLTLFGNLKERDSLVKEWTKLPGIIKRKLVKPLQLEIKPAFDNDDSLYLEYTFKRIYNDLKEINELVIRLPKAYSENLIKKMFSSVVNFEDVKKNVKNISNSLSFIDEDNRVEKEFLLEGLQYYNADLILDKGDVVVVKANDAEAIRNLGCFSSWCFSQFGGEHYWGEYATLGYVYVIYDFSKDTEDARFLMVYLPDGGGVYLSNNIPFEDTYEDEDEYEYLNSLGIDINLMR